MQLPKPSSVRCVTSTPRPSAASTPPAGTRPTTTSSASRPRGPLAAPHGRALDALGRAGPEYQMFAALVDGEIVGFVGSGPARDKDRPAFASCTSSTCSTRTTAPASARSCSTRPSSDDASTCGSPRTTPAHTASTRATASSLDGAYAHGALPRRDDHRGPLRPLTRRRAATRRGVSGRAASPAAPRVRVIAMSIPVILDVDTGVDDALAILFAVKHPGIDVLGITCVAGNASLERVVDNTLRVLDAAGAPDIPVAAGAVRPLLEPPAFGAARARRRRPRRHRAAADRAGPRAGRRGRAHAPRSSSSTRRPVTLVALAPQTNLALLLRTHPEVAGNIERIVFMGGSASVGNATAVAEFNVWHDPEAAAIVLDAGVPAYMYGLDVFNRVAIEQEWPLALGARRRRRSAASSARCSGTASRSARTSRPSTPASSATPAPCAPSSTRSRCAPRGARCASSSRATAAARRSSTCASDGGEDAVHGTRRRVDRRGRRARGRRGAPRAAVPRDARAGTTV